MCTLSKTTILFYFKQKLMSMLIYVSLIERASTLIQFSFTVNLQIPKQEYCCLCFKRCKENSRRHVPPEIRFRHYMEKIMSRDVSNVDVICNCCSARVYRKIKENDSERKKASHIEEPFVNVIQFYYMVQ